MSLSLFLPAAGLVFGGYFLNYCQGQQAQRLRLRQQGLVDVAALQRLLEAIPQHRGMANALLQGDASFREKRLALAQQIDNDMARLQALVGNTDAWQIGPRVRQVLDQWRDIQQRLDGFSPPQSFEAHTRLVQCILYLIQDVAEAAGLLHGEDSRQRQLAHVAMQVMPLLTELLGQARGLGAGVAAKGRCGVDMRVKLRYLLNKAREKGAELSQLLQSSGQLGGTGLASVFRHSEEAQARFLVCLDEQLINAGHIQISAKEYFEIGTQAIQQGFAVLAAVTHSLQGQLDEEWRLAQGGALVLRSAAAAFVLGGVALFLHAF